MKALTGTPSGSSQAGSKLGHWEIGAVKLAFGEDIAFLGGIDITRAMPGSIEDVMADADRCLSDLAPGGGYVLAPCNHLQSDVPAENVIKLFKYVRENGNY